MRRPLVNARNKILGLSMLNKSIEELSKRMEGHKEARYCPICGNRAVFGPGPNGRPDACCRKCGSLERHR